MTIALDPGPNATQVCGFDGERALSCFEIPNADLVETLQEWLKDGDQLACESIVSYGQAVGRIHIQDLRNHWSPQVPVSSDTDDSAG